MMGYLRPYINMRWVINGSLARSASGTTRQLLRRLFPRGIININTTKYIPELIDLRRGDTGTVNINRPKFGAAEKKGGDSITGNLHTTSDIYKKQF
jgi:hypothetical protein